eukprot:GHVU01107105.1.p1 GENE.GHVU01107105.1~~GHVU01107105.1.p1  ORF type:complete len:174 (+),score=4.12 GHVU01107105.1:303-824(+)
MHTHYCNVGLKDRASSRQAIEVLRRAPHAHNRPVNINSQDPTVAKCRDYSSQLLAQSTSHPRDLLLVNTTRFPDHKPLSLAISFLSQFPPLYCIDTMTICGSISLHAAASTRRCSWSHNTATVGQSTVIRWIQRASKVGIFPCRSPTKIRLTTATSLSELLSRAEVWAIKSLL